MAAITTYELVADTQIYTGSGVLCSIQVITDGINDAKAILYDISSAGDAAATNKLQEMTINGALHHGQMVRVEPTLFKTGLYLDLTGTGASAIVEYRKG